MQLPVPKRVRTLLRHSPDGTQLCCVDKASTLRPSLPLHRGCLRHAIALLLSLRAAASSAVDGRARSRRRFVTACFVRCRCHPRNGTDCAAGRGQVRVLGRAHNAGARGRPVRIARAAQLLPPPAASPQALHAAVRASPVVRPRVVYDCGHGQPETISGGWCLACWRWKRLRGRRCCRTSVDQTAGAYGISEYAVPLLPNLPQQRLGPGNGLEQIMAGCGDDARGALPSSAIATGAEGAAADAKQRVPQRAGDSSTDHGPGGCGASTVSRRRRFGHFTATKLYPCARHAVPSRRGWNPVDVSASAGRRGRPNVWLLARVGRTSLRDTRTAVAVSLLLPAP